MNISIKANTSRYILQFYTEGELNGPIFYVRSNAKEPTPVFLAQMICGTYVKGGFCEVDHDRMPGLYQFGVPNEALLAGASSVAFYFAGTKPTVIVVELREQENLAMSDVNITKIAGQIVSKPGTPGGLLVNGDNDSVSFKSILVKDGVSITKPEHGNAVEISTENGHGIAVNAKGPDKNGFHIVGENKAAHFHINS